MTQLSQLAWPRTTERLTIRLATPDDAVDVFTIRSHPEVARWLASWPQSFIDFRAALTLSVRFTLIVELDQKTIGTLHCKVINGWAQREVVSQAQDTQAELGWSFHPDHQGHGYAREAVNELLNIVFEASPSGLGLRRLEAHSFAENTSSIKLMEAIGMRRESYRVQESLHRDGTWRDGVSYAMLAREWELLRS